jgi:glucose-6-phosphate isomerase, archaeal
MPLSSLKQKFDPGLDVQLSETGLSFSYGPKCFGPEPEMRRLDAIRQSLLDPQCSGPDPVYGICMDVGQWKDEEELKRRYLLFGLVAYASGTLGREPVRSQGHVHALSPHSGWSAPELFEIWQGRAIVYAQEFTGNDPGRCFAIEGGPGDHIVVPPGWAHCVINADPNERMVFGALCDRQYGFVYDGVRAHHGLAWFPLVEGDKISWQRNPSYAHSALEVRGPRQYGDLNVRTGVPLYTQFENDHNALQWVSQPGRCADIWKGFKP